jgi:hypothetical protein
MGDGDYARTEGPPTIGSDNGNFPPLYLNKQNK